MHMFGDTYPTPKLSVRSHTWHIQAKLNLAFPEMGHISSAPVGGSVTEARPMPVGLLWYSAGTSL